jgi:hypothetical protein
MTMTMIASFYDVLTWYCFYLGAKNLDFHLTFPPFVSVAPESGKKVV